MAEQNITCPKCKHEFPLTETLAAPLVASVRHECEQLIAQKDAELASRESSIKQRESAVKTAAVAAARDQARVLQLQSKFNNAKLKMEQIIQKRVQKITVAAENKARRDMRMQLEGRYKPLLADARRRVTEERVNGIRVGEIQERGRTATERAGYERKIAELMRQLERRKNDERGEFRVEEVLRALREAFSADNFTSLPKRRGYADIRHDVNENGRACGTIIYECKDVGPGWSSTWINQVRNSRRTHKTRHVVLVTSVFPRGKNHLAFERDVPVVHPDLVIYLARIIRTNVVLASHPTVSSDERKRRADRLYEFIRSEEFKQQFGIIGESVGELRRLKETEQGAHERLWIRQEELFSSIANSAIRANERIDLICETPALAIVAAGE